MKITREQFDVLAAKGLRPFPHRWGDEPAEQFAEACYNTNRAAELFGFDTATLDDALPDMEQWGITLDAWRQAQREALELAMYEYVYVYAEGEGWTSKQLEESRP